MATKKIKSQSLFRQGEHFVTAKGEKLADVYIPPAPAKKGTPAYKIWAKESFATLVANGFNYSQAAERLGLSYRWWRQLAAAEPDGSWWALRRSGLDLEALDGALASAQTARAPGGSGDLKGHTDARPASYRRLLDELLDD